jgi:hypothetical protein
MTITWKIKTQPIQQSWAPGPLPDRRALWFVQPSSRRCWLYEYITVQNFYTAMSENVLTSFRCQTLSGSGGVLPLPDHRPATYWVHYTTGCIAQSNAPEDGQNNCPKYVELIGIINKQLFLHLVGCLLYYCDECVVYDRLSVSYLYCVLWPDFISCFEWSSHLSNTLGSPGISFYRRH